MSFGVNIFDKINAKKSHLSMMTWWDLVIEILISDIYFKTLMCSKAPRTR